MGESLNSRNFIEYEEAATFISWCLDFAGDHNRWPYLKNTVRVDSKRPTYVGRGVEGENFVISDPRVSRRHAKLEVTANGLQVTDMGSANGTYVNGEKITKPTSIRVGDFVAFDRVLFQVRQSFNIPDFEVMDNSGVRSANLARERLMYNKFESSSGATPHLRRVRLKSRYSAYTPVLSGAALAIFVAALVVYLL